MFLIIITNLFKSIIISGNASFLSHRCQHHQQHRLSHHVFLHKTFSTSASDKVNDIIMSKSDHHQHRAFHCPTYGHWEYDSAIVLGRNAIQGLKVSQLRINIIKLKFGAAESNKEFKQLKLYLCLL